MSESDPLKVIRYETLLECMAEFLGCDESEVEDQDGTWIWGDWTGKEYRMSMKEAISKIVGDDVWSWLEDKETIHIWFDENVGSKRLLEVIAHEIGHSCRPFHRGAIKEEQKANTYEMVAGTAFDIMNDLLESE